ncbi:hypothetical protein ACSBLW_13035 [Thioclava sp. FR2]|uniref:hypothetical protein n=1 Tax=Thioclava sp. FR2 TaxID=3445780 RepID=UPI003EB931EB
MKRRTPPNYVPAVGESVSVADLTDMVDEALALLESRFPVDGREAHRPNTPLPSLLERCEDLISRSAEVPPIRVIVSFSPRLPSRIQSLIAHLPNLSEIYGSKLANPALSRVSSDLPDGVETRRQAGLSAFLKAELDLSKAGKFPVLVLAGSAPAGSEPGLLAKDLGLLEGENRRVVGVAIAEHPLKSWMSDRHFGLLSESPMPLETYAQRYLEFLEGNPFPVLTVDGLLQDPASGLAEIAKHLDVPVGRGGAEPELHSIAETGGPVIHYSDGSIATDEPLDTPQYEDLCETLGYEPAFVAISDPGAGVRANSPLALASSLRAFSTDRPAARLATFLPQLSLLLDASQGASTFTVDLKRLIELVEDCLSHADGFYERLDVLCSGLSPADGALLLVTCASHYASIGENIHCIALLNEAQRIIPLECRPLHLLAARLYLRCGKPDLAVRQLIVDALEGPMQLPVPQRDALDRVIGPVIAPKGAEHGHVLLIDWLTARPPEKIARRRVLIEIGTTRETVPGQGSTEKLAMLCDSLGIDFITVDMDPRNSAMARRLFKRLGLNFRAVTSKGEDFLAQWDGPIDYCFLDAYDFDHGQHSELRQSRYESFLGSRISDAQCHQMHLDCATSLVGKLAPDGVICFDDTWTDEDGAWTAKGKTAMPYLMDHGFKVTDARNRAALLERG